MTDFYEIDFLEVGGARSGDAIAARFEINGEQYIHVVDGGYQATGKELADHIRAYYGKSAYIDHVVVTHPDGDHAGGLRTILEEFAIGRLWMIRPWLYAEELIDNFTNYSSVDNLRSRLRSI